MLSICVVGGTRFFGKAAVRRLVDLGHDVTILTRGFAHDDFGNEIRRLHGDANSLDDMRAALEGRMFDVALHQMCYSPVAAKIAALAFDGRAGHLIMTSTIEVYNTDTFKAEHQPKLSSFAREDELKTKDYGFDESLPWREPQFIESHYAEGRRQAESALATISPLPISFVRAGHVLSAKDEFTGRFQFHVDRILKGIPIGSWPKPGKTSFVYAEDIASFLAWLCERRPAGTLNACSPEGIDIYELCAAIERAAGRSARIQEISDPRGDASLSPFSYPGDFCMSTERANGLGYWFAPVADWLPRIAASAVASVKN